MALPDLSVIFDETKKAIEEIEGIEPRLPADLRQRLAEVLPIKFNGTSAERVVNPRVIFPLEWFYIGAKLVPLYQALVAYKKNLENFPLNREDCDNWRKGNETEQLRAQIDDLDLDLADSDLLFKFATKQDWWRGAKTIDRGDFAVPSLMSAGNLLAASASFLAEEIVPILSGHPDLIGEINKLINDGSGCERQFDYADSVSRLIAQFLVDACCISLVANNETSTRLASSLLSKRFLIATGLSGSGKTKLAQSFSRWLVPSYTDRDAPNPNYALVSVGADWTGNENILGYPDGLQSAQYVTKPALDLILHAADHADIPHFLILDEMNLSHVERYFADILSLIESDEGVVLYSGDMETPETWRRTSALKPVPPKLFKLPSNLFIIGTVNVDETTYMFSPKVLDRANVIEFRMDAVELEQFLQNSVKPDHAKLDGKGAGFGKAFVEAAQSAVSVPADIKALYDAEMLLLFKALQTHGAEFGYRTAYETSRFMYFFKLLGQHADGNTAWFSQAFDCVILQKLLPKLHGSRAKLGPVLKKLWFLCVSHPDVRGADALSAATESKLEPTGDAPKDAPYPLSAEKIVRMWRLLMENGFASFAEA